MSPCSSSQDERLCRPAPDYAADAKWRPPETTAKSLRIAPIAGWVGLLVGGCVFGALLDPHAVLPILHAMLGVPFLSLALLRSAALIHMARKRGRERAAMRCADVSCSPEILPTYAVLVPLFKEAEIIGQLIEGLGKIDYPADRLQISLIVKEGDIGPGPPMVPHNVCYASFSRADMAGNWLVGFGTFNLMAGYLTAMALDAMAVIPQKSRIAWSVLAMPAVYWVAISCAAYRALWQLISAPYFWETTLHYGCKTVPIGTGAVSPNNDKTGKTARARQRTLVIAGVHRPVAHLNHRRQVARIAGPYAGS